MSLFLIFYSESERKYYEKRPFEDPFEIHEKLKRNIMLQIQADPRTIDHSNLDKRLEMNLRTIKPSSMNENRKVDDVSTFIFMLNLFR